MISCSLRHFVRKSNLLNYLISRYFLCHTAIYSKFGREIINGGKINNRSETLKWGMFNFISTSDLADTLLLLTKKLTLK